MKIRMVMVHMWRAFPQAMEDREEIVMEVILILVLPRKQI
jgi:hypothetical protein